jgi:TorA maturation chaperone TorD
VEKLSKILSYCADILDYPEKETIQKFNSLPKEIMPATKTGTHLTQSLEELQNAYIGLFVNNIKGLECVPYASWWSEKRLMGNETIKIKNFYQKCGFELNEKEFKSPPDHISLEIAFLSKILEEKQFNEVCEMIRKHLYWIKDLKECVERKNSFYGAVLSITINTVNTIKEDICIKIH